MAGHQQKRCLYEVLGVNRDSSQEEIRSSYRRLALQLHPDKLAQSGAAAGADSTAAFQELLHAYEVLSDPKERSWYDSHRSQILFSDPSSASKSRTSSLGVDLFSFFSSSVYSGYTDSGKGFFKVYGDVFSKIYAQELHFAEKLGFPSDDVAPPPLIGNLDSPYSQVTAFYSYWLGYSTVMDFTWVDEYDSFAGPNRKARRLMEEENKKARKKAKREHNDTVRGLAAFVKKRDKRVLDMQMKKKKEEEKRLADEKERKKEEERRRKEKAVMYQESEWAKNDEENEIIWDEDEDDKRKKKGEVELYCVACNKKFKSDKQWKNHEQSKKHREKVAELRSTFDEEEYALKDIAQEGLCTSFDYEPHVEDNESSDSNNPDQLSESFRDDFKLEEEGDVPHVEDNESSDSNNPDQLSESFRDDFKLEEEGDDNGNENADGLPSNAEVAGPDDDNGIEKDVEYHDLKSHRNRRNRRAKKGTGREPEARDASEEANGSQKNDNGAHEDNVEGHFEEFSYTVKEFSENSKGDQVDRSQKIKKQQLDEKGHTKKDTVPQKGSSKGKKQKGATKAHTNSCGTCGESFDSRNKLFAHLGNTGHAMLKSWRGQKYCDCGKKNPRQTQFFDITAEATMDPVFDKLFCMCLGEMLLDTPFEVAGPP